MRSIPVDPTAIRSIFVDIANVPDYAPNGGDLIVGSHKADSDGRLLYSITALVKVAGETGGETIKVRVPADKPPALEEFAQVVFPGLRARAWSQGDRSGVSYSAESVQLANGNGHRPAPVKAEG